jgi:hypothetical protein
MKEKNRYRPEFERLESRATPACLHQTSLLVDDPADEKVEITDESEAGPGDAGEVTTMDFTILDESITEPEGIIEEFESPPEEEVTDWDLGEPDYEPGDDCLDVCGEFPQDDPVGDEHCEPGEVVYMTFSIEVGEPGETGLPSIEESSGEPQGGNEGDGVPQPPGDEGEVYYLLSATSGKPGIKNRRKAERPAEKQHHRLNRGLHRRGDWGMWLAHLGGLRRRQKQALRHFLGELHSRLQADL